MSSLRYLPLFQTYTISTASGASVPLGVTVYPRIMPDSSRVIFNHKQPPFDLQSVPIAGGEVRNLSWLDNQADLGDSTISPDSRWIVFEVLYKTGGLELRVSDGTEAQPAPPQFTRSTCLSSCADPSQFFEGVVTS